MSWNSHIFKPITTTRQATMKQIACTIEGVQMLTGINMEVMFIKTMVLWLLNRLRNHSNDYWGLMVTMDCVTRIHQHIQPSLSYTQPIVTTPQIAVPNKWFYGF